MRRRVGAIFAHPDDEVLGCGGTSSKFAENGSDVHTLILSQGITSRENFEKKKKTELIKQAKKASKILGNKTIEFCDFPDNEMDKVSLLQIIKKIEAFIKKYHIDIIFTHDFYDLNNDHKIINKAVVTASRPFVNKIKLFSCEVLSSSEANFSISSTFRPNVFVDIESTLPTKINAMNEYKLELREWPHPRSIKGIQYQSYLRGSQSGLKAAEAFKLLVDIYPANNLP